MKVRLKFSKTGPLRFIGHLDLMRTFQKIFRRANLPIAYSEGYNPHQIFSIAAPLALGVTSHAEYMDLKLTKEMECDAIVHSINAVCPNGIKIIKATIMNDKEPAAMASVDAAKYTIEQKERTITQDSVENFLEQDEIMVEKKSKKGRLRNIDIKPGIIYMTVEDSIIQLTVATGSQLNIKPEFVLQSICKSTNVKYNRFNYCIHRDEIYHGKDKLLPLSETIL